MGSWFEAAWAKESARMYTNSVVEALADGLTFKGQVDSTDDLPLSGNTKGDMWLVASDGGQYVWKIDASSGSLSDYAVIGPNQTIELNFVTEAGTPVTHGVVIAY